MPVDMAPPSSANLQGFNVAPAQYTDPLATLAQMGQLRQQNLQTQAAQMQIQQQQMELDSSRGLMQAYSDANGNLDTLKNIASDPKYKILPSQLISMQQTMQKLAMDRAQTALYGSEADKNAQAALDDKHDKLFEAYSPVWDEKDPAKQQALLGQINQQLASQGWDAKDLLPTDSSPDAIQHAKNAYTTFNNIKSTAEALKAKAESEQQAALTKKTNLETQQLRSQLDWLDSLTPKTLGDYVGASIDKTKYPDLYARAYNDASNARGMRKPELVQAAIDKYAAIASEQEKQKALDTDPDIFRKKIDLAKIEAQNRQNITLQGLGTADQPSTAAQMVADYQVPLATALTRVPMAGRQIFLSQVKAANPDFQAEYYDAFKKTEESATSGKIATSANALNTMMGHLTVLKQAADALNNGDIQVLNRIANAWGAAVGKTPKTTYDTIVHRLGPEVTSAYLAAGGTAGERGTNEEDFSSSLGGDQIKQNIGISAYLADSKIKALQDQYQRGTYGRGKQQLISDDAENARQTLTQLAPANLRGGGAGGGAGGGRGGNAPVYKRQIRNPKTNQVIGLGQDNQWHDVQTGAVVK